MLAAKGVTTPSGGVRGPFFCIQSTGNDDAAPWPYRFAIRARFLDSVPAVVQDILTSTLEEWFASQPTREINVQWVQTGDAEVRFAMTTNLNGATTCALGKNVPTNQQQPTVCLAWGAWKEGESEVVWSHQDVERMARHVWGHVLGLPHAYNGSSFQWKDSALTEVCGTMGMNKSQVTQLRGTPKLDGSDSVMHYDRPSGLVTSPLLYLEQVAGGIDSKTSRFLNELYPTAKEYEIFHEACTNMPHWIVTWKDQKMYTREHATKFHAVWRISALNHVNLGTSGNYAAAAYTTAESDSSKKSCTIHMGASDSNVHIYDIKASFLNFKGADSSVQTGFVETADIRKSWTTSTPAERFDQPVKFSQAFKSPPQVVVFIFRFNTSRGNWIRLSAFPKDITTTGFTLCLHTWSDTLAHDIGAYWLAHATDDPAIRSGRWEPPQHPGTHATEDQSTLSFSSPLIAKPRNVFCGFNYVDTPGGVDIRFKCEAPSWTEKSVDMKIAAWEKESAYHAMGASYIALL